MYPDSEDEQRTWMKMLSIVVDLNKNKTSETIVPNMNNQLNPDMTNNTTTNTTPNTNGTGDMNNINNTSNGTVQTQNNGVKTSPMTNMSVRDKLGLVKDSIPALNNPATLKLVEFWKAWFQSLPTIEEARTTSQDPITFDLITSANMSKIVWKCSGPQSAYIQKMVDFFWIVGSPGTEIERLNDIGAEINPSIIGSWITISNKGGMDGGWFFPVPMDVPTSLDAIDPGEAKTAFQEWLNTHGITNILLIGRDMGAHPPRQTEIKFALPGTSYEEKINKALAAFDYFHCSRMPSDALEIIREKPKDEVFMNIVLSSGGFVQVGLILPSPDDGNVNKLCALCGSSYDTIKRLQETLRVSNPSHVEYQFLLNGFGYGVYKEGFDVLFHYRAGEET